jgi:hypothetical protein
MPKAPSRLSRLAAASPQHRPAWSVLPTSKETSRYPAHMRGRASKIDMFLCVVQNTSGIKSRKLVLCGCQILHSIL